MIEMLFFPRFRYIDFTSILAIYTQPYNLISSNAPLGRTNP